MRAANVPGDRGRLRELFDFLADRGANGPPASQADIAEDVFGQSDAVGDDATVRVYIHRLRKRLDDHYAALADANRDSSVRLTVPAGAYALRFAGPTADLAIPAQATPPAKRLLPWPWLAIAALLLVAGFLGGRWLAPAAPAVNALWQPFVDSTRPLTIVVGDYYIFGDIDELRPEEGRLIRDFRINSPTDLARAQETQPARYGAAEDMGLYYLPMASAYALRDLMPVLAAAHRQVDVIPASQLQASTLRTSDIVYVGLVSGMGMLEDLAFMGSGFSVGETYDELIDGASNRAFVSEEARSLALPVFYRDYGFVARFHAPGGGLVAVLAGARDTGLRGIAPLVSDDLPPPIAKLAKQGDFEALYQITGQQGADLSERLVVGRARTAGRPE